MANTNKVSVSLHLLLLKQYLRGSNGSSSLRTCDDSARFYIDTGRTRTYLRLSGRWMYVQEQCLTDCDISAPHQRVFVQYTNVEFQQV